MTSTSSYPALLDALRDISSTEQTARTHDRERRKVNTYWHMGGAIHTHVLDHQGRGNTLRIFHQRRQTATRKAACTHVCPWPRSKNRLHAQQMAQLYSIVQVLPVNGKTSGFN